MTTLERRLYLAGVTLFLIGLALGFAVPAFADRRAILNAHLTALGSGTFLIVMGVIWNKLAAAPKFSGLLAHALWISFYVLEAGLTLIATVPAPAPGSPPTATQNIGGILNAIGAILMFISVATVLVLLIRSRKDK